MQGGSHGRTPKTSSLSHIRTARDTRLRRLFSPLELAAPADCRLQLPGNLIDGSYACFAVCMIARRRAANIHSRPTKGGGRSSPCQHIHINGPWRSASDGQGCIHPIFNEEGPVSSQHRNQRMHDTEPEPVLWPTSRTCLACMAIRGRNLQLLRC